MGSAVEGTALKFVFFHSQAHSDVMMFFHSQAHSDVMMYF